MATFAQYVAPQVPRTDWGAITRELSTGLQEVYKDRENQKVELDKMQSDAMAEVNKIEMGKSQTVNEFTLNGINTMRDYMASQNKLLKQGMLTPAQYKMNILRAQEGWGAYANNMKTFNQDYADFLERVDGDTASALEKFAREKYLSMTDLVNKQLYINPADGNLYIAKTDPKTGQVITEGLMDVKTINNALNQKVTKLDLGAAVNNYVKRFGQYGGKDPVTGKYVLAGIDLNQKDKILTETTAAILSNNKAIASVLLDNATGFEAVSPEDYAKLSPEEKRKAVVVKPNAQGIYTPEITPELMAQAEEVVKQAIMAQVDYKEEQGMTEYQRKSLGLQYTALSEGRKAAAGKSAQKGNLIQERVKNINEFLVDPTNPQGPWKYIKGAKVEGLGTVSKIERTLGGQYKVTFKTPSGDSIIESSQDYNLAELSSLYNDAANAKATDPEYKISMEEFQNLLDTNQGIRTAPWLRPQQESQSNDILGYWRKASSPGRYEYL